MSKSVNNVQELGMLANSMTRDYSALAGDCRGAVAASTNPQVPQFTTDWISRRTIKPNDSDKLLYDIVYATTNDAVQLLL